MTKSEILEFIRKNPTFALATVEDNVPSVRMMILYRADGKGLIIFNTGENKDINRQLSKNPNVEMCFYNTEGTKQIRISGAVEVVEDQQIKKEIVKDHQFLSEWVDKEGYDVLVVYCLKQGRATVWTMETNFKPKEYVQL